MIDYHTHTWRCRHADGEVGDYVRSAVRLGLREIGISDHFPMDALGFPPEDVCSMPEDELTAYVREVREARCVHRGDMAVRLGIEVDYVPEAEEEILAAVGAGPWDYVIGSVHFLHGTDITNSGNTDYFCGRPLMDIYDDYFEVVNQLIRCGGFDVLGHADAVKKHGHVPGPDRAGRLREHYQELARFCAAHDQVVEINTSGLRAAAGEMYPARDLLRELIRRDVPLTIGSDAHTPAEVGDRAGEVVEMLSDMGVHRVIGFSDRKPHEIPL